MEVRIHAFPLALLWPARKGSHWAISIKHFYARKCIAVNQINIASQICSCNCMNLSQPQEKSVTNLRHNLVGKDKLNIVYVSMYYYHMFTCIELKGRTYLFISLLRFFFLNENQFPGASANLLKCVWYVSVYNDC